MLIVAEGFESTGPELLKHRAYNLHSDNQAILIGPNNITEADFITGRNGLGVAIKNTNPTVVVFKQPVPHIFISFALKATNPAVNPILLYIKGVTGGTMALIRIINSTNRTEFQRGDGFVMVSAPNYIIRDGTTWNWLSLEYLPSNTNGYAALYDANGNLVGSFSGDTLHNETQGLVSFILFEFFLEWWIDDLIINDDQPSGHPGNPYFTKHVPESRIETILPNGPGDLNDFTPNGAPSLWECLDDSPLSNLDTDYVETTNTNAKYLVNLHPTDLTDIRAVVVTSALKRNDSALWEVKNIIRPSPTSPYPYYESSDTDKVFNPTIYTSFSTMWLVNPDSNTAWNKNDISMLQAGIRAIGY